MSQSKRRHRVRCEAPGEHRFLTFSCHQRLPLFSNDQIKTAFALRLAELSIEQTQRLVAWVIMPEHVHLLLLPRLPEISVDRFLYRLKRPFAYEILERWRELDAPILPRITDADGRHRFWLRGGGYDRNIYTQKEFEEKFDYIHDNPVRRGLVDRPTDWKWSSARWYDQKRAGPHAIDPEEWGNTE
ncbi:MAG: hypothetical protein EA376_09685 [Phycisphaeraceae bacterium]|nr:MAG: hypothetical protein EA376_09685 [Phycisphaeraceae bacterium]